MHIISVKKSSTVGDDVSYCEMNPVSEARERIEMKENSAYISRAVQRSDDDATYDTIAGQ